MTTLYQPANSGYGSSSSRRSALNAYPIPLLFRPALSHIPRPVESPQALPVLLSLAIASGCYLGLQKLRQYQPAFALPQPRWEGKGYRIDRNEDTMREVLFSIEL